MFDDRGSSLAPMVRKLALWQELSTGEQEALLLLPHRLGRVQPGDYIVEQGTSAEQSIVLRR